MRDYLLVCDLCARATRRIQGDVRIPWIYANEPLAFCDVSKEDTVVLPSLEERQFDECLHHLNPTTQLQLGHGERIICQEHGPVKARE